MADSPCHACPLRTVTTCGPCATLVLLHHSLFSSTLRTRYPSIPLLLSVGGGGWYVEFNCQKLLDSSTASRTADNCVS
jgi:hypothetical protein